MNTTDVQLVLGYASSIDPRVRRNDPTERQFQVTAWSAQLAHFDAADARAAIDQHYAAADPPALLPGRLRTLITAIRADRLAAIPETEPAADPDDIPRYLAALRAGRRRLASGAERPRPVDALVSSAFRSAPN